MAKRHPGNLTYLEQAAYEVQWYRMHGKHTDRIRKDTRGNKYVMSDFLWNDRYPKRREHVKDRINDYIYEKETGLKK